MNELREDLSLSIVFLTYNKCKSIRKTVRSFLEKLDDKAIEFIVVDNHSADETEVYLNEIIENDPRLKYFKTTKNLGAAGGRNYGFKKSKSRYVLFVDDDILFNGDIKSLVKMQKYFELNKKLAVLTCRLFDESTQNLIELRLKESDREISDSYAFHGAFHMVDKEKIKGTLYPTELYFGCEELFLYLKLLAYGYEVKCCNDIILLHFGERRDSIEDVERIYYALVNECIVKKNLYPKFLVGLVYLMFILKIFKYTKMKNLKNILNYKQEFQKRNFTYSGKKINYKKLLEITKFK